MKHVFGPVPSRRLGNSLGIDPIPSKYCNFGCVYCQLGHTSLKTNTRQDFIDPYIILDEIKLVLTKEDKNIDYITILASGEPLLNSDIGFLIKKIKKMTKIPICLITNGALLASKSVQDEILDLDVIMPTLDAGNENLFLKINRPHHEINYNQMIKGMINYRKKYAGQIWMEVMLIKDLNDSKQDLEEIREKLDLINPDRVYVNVPIRPPTESWVKIPSDTSLELANEILKPYKDISKPETGDFSLYSDDFESELLAIISRHPLREDQIYKTFSKLKNEDIDTKLAELLNNKKIKKVEYESKIFWQYIP